MKWQLLGGVKFRVSCPIVVSRQEEDGERRIQQWLAPPMMSVPQLENVERVVDETFAKVKSCMERLQVEGSGWR